MSAKGRISYKGRDDQFATNKEKTHHDGMRALTYPQRTAGVSEEEKECTAGTSSETRAGRW